MTSDGAQSHEARSEMQLKFIGFLLAIALSILGWGFNNWSKAVETGMDQVMVKLNRIEVRSEQRDERVYEISKDVSLLSERHQSLRQAFDSHLQEYKTKP